MSDSTPWEQHIFYGSFWGSFVYIAICGYDSGDSVNMYLDSVYVSLEYPPSQTPTLTVNAIDPNIGWSIPTDVYIDGTWVGNAPISIQVMSGTNLISVDNVVPVKGYYGYFEVFQGFEDSNGIIYQSNPAAVTMTSSMTITAYYSIQYG